MKNSLRTFRKKTEITIEDISQLLNMHDSSTLSRFERGYRKPSLEIIFTYHLLFEVSIEKIFEFEIKETYQKIRNNITPLIDDLKKQTKTKKVEARIAFLNSLKAIIDKKYEG